MPIFCKISNEDPELAWWYECRGTSNSKKDRKCCTFHLRVDVFPDEKRVRTTGVNLSHNCNLEAIPDEEREEAIEVTRTLEEQVKEEALLALAAPNRKDSSRMRL